MRTVDQQGGICILDPVHDNSQIVLGIDQMSIESGGTGIIKLGDGVTRYADLPNIGTSGGGSFPDFTGSGSPEGVVTAAVGKWYQDIDNGALYKKINDAGGNTCWACVAGPNDPSSITAGLTMYATHPGPDMIYVVLASGGNQYLSITDRLGFENSGNALYWDATAGDGAQKVYIQLGDSGQFQTEFNADGSTQLPGALKTTGGAGFNGSAPVGKAAAPVLLSDVITILRNLGLCS